VVSLSVKTDPHSFVGLLGVDQSVQLLRSGNDLSHEHILDNLSNFSSNELVTLTNANINTGRLTGSTWGSGSETGIPRSYETLEKESAAPSLSTWELNTRRGWNGLLEGMGMGQRRGTLSTQSSYFQLHLWVICCDCCWPKLMLSGFQMPLKWLAALLILDEL